MSAIPPDADKPRLVHDYGGMQLLDAREHLRVKLLGEPPKGVRWSLKDAGFKPMPGDANTYYRLTNPQAIFAAQMIGATFFPTAERDS